jgi:BirA family biotin operon repressor/biotin-[acetyl-CoA-carboxylase] ligase
MVDTAVLPSRWSENETGLAHDRLCVGLIRRRLTTERVGFQTYVFDEVTSTNEVLRRLADAGALDGTVVIAECQRAGRGRLGKPWFSPGGVNLYASVLFRPSIAPADVPVFAFIASLALTDAIRGEGVPAAIKRPNDVLVDRRKVAGSLVTCSVAGDAVEYVVLGVGVNLNVDRHALDAGLGAAAASATSLAEVAGHSIDRNVFTAAFLNSMERWADVYRTRGPEAILGAWRARDVLAGRLVEVREPQTTYRAEVLEITRDGRLVAEDARGVRRELVAGEITILY